MSKSKLNLYFLFLIPMFFSSCGSDDNTPAPAPTPAPVEIITYKIQAKVGTKTGVNASSPLGDTDALELNPNDLTKLSTELSVFENTTLKTSGVTYTLVPDASTVSGVTVSNTSGIYKLTIAPEAYKITTDVNYILLATMGTVEKTRKFIIKGIVNYIPVASLNLTRKPNQTTVTATAGGEEVDLTTVFDIIFAPDNVTKKNVIWSIDPVNPVAAITSDGVLTPLSDGIVKIKVTSVFAKDLSSSTLDFTINAATTAVKLKNLSLERKSSKLFTTTREGNSINLFDVFNINFNPPNATDRRVVWSIEPPDPTVATITDEGMLNPISTGKIHVKVTSVSIGVWSNTESFNIAPALKLVGRVGNLISIYTSGITSKSGIIEEDEPMEIDPNDDSKVIGMFYVSESIAISTIPNVEYSVNPVLPVGVTVMSNSPTPFALNSNSGTSPYTIQVDPAKYTATTDVVYTFTARVGLGSSAFTKTRTFTIKGNKIVVPTSITLVRKIGQENTVVKAGNQNIDLTTIFDVNFVPDNTTIKNLKWYITPEKPLIATITEAGLLNINSAGDIILLVISDFNSSIRITEKFNIAPAETHVPVTSITLARKTGKENRKVRVSVKNYDVNNVFEYTINPVATSDTPGVSNKNVIWTIYPRNDDVATITEEGLLTTTSKGGTIMLRVTSISEIDKSSSTIAFVVDGSPVIKASVSASLISSLNSLGGSNPNLGSLITGNLFGDTQLEDDELVVLDPNGTDKLSVSFTVVEGDTTKEFGHDFKIIPEIPISQPGIIGDDNIRDYTLTLQPTTYTVLTDKTYTMQVRIYKTQLIISRQFKILGKTAVPVTSISITRKTAHSETKGRLGVNIELDDIFDITFVPENASNKTVTWSIDPAQDAVATIEETKTDPVKLIIVSTGTIMLKVTSKSETNISDSVPFEIEDAKILELIGTLPEPGNGKFNVGWLINGDDKYNLGVINIENDKFVKGGVPVDKVTANTKYLITVESASSAFNAVALTSPSVNGLNLLEIALTNVEGGENPVSKFNNQEIPTENQTFILATPSNGDATNERSGVWFKKAATTPTAGLTLPTLTGDYSYEGWIVVGDKDNLKYMSMGKFKNPAVADDDRFYYNPPASGVTLPPFPGEDFLVNPTEGIRKIEDVTMPIAVNYKVIITIEPTEEISFAEISPSSFLIYEKEISTAETTGTDLTLDKSYLLNVKVIVK